MDLIGDIAGRNPRTESCKVAQKDSRRVTVIPPILSPPADSPIPSLVHDVLLTSSSRDSPPLEGRVRVYGGGDIQNSAI